MTLAPNQLRALRIAFAANVVAAGVPGLLIVLFPAFAEANVLAAAQDPFTMGIAGSVWLAIGVLSAVGLARPAPIAPILLIQIVYKSVWIVAVGLPLLAAGDPRALPFVVFFALAIALFAWALPFRALFGRTGAAPVGAVGSSAAD